jgi:hypothetical protein
MVVSSTPVARVARLAEAARALATSAIAYVATAGIVATLLLVIFDWSLSRMLVGTGIGAVVWAAQRYFFDIAPLVPRGLVEEAPAGVEVKSIRFEASDVWRLPLLVALCAAVAAAADLTGIGAALAVGWPLGYALADLVVLLRIWRWERANGRRIVIDPDAEEQRPYAGAPL